MKDRRPRIIIADDHFLIADLCKRLLEAEFNVVGVATDGRTLVSAVAELKPDVIVVDISMPILNGLDAGDKAKEMAPALKVIYLTMNPDIRLAAEAFRRGASGYLLKTCAPAELVKAIREVLQGKTYVCSSLHRDELRYHYWSQSRPPASDMPLTNREREVLQLIAEGKVMKEIGEILGVTPRTVAFHKYKMMERLGASCNADLIRYALKESMVSG